MIKNAKNDSKKLTKRRLMMAYDYVKENAIDYSCVWMV